MKGIQDGTIDAVSSGHSPKDIESKFCEFDNADFGGISLEATFGALNKLADGVFLDEQIINLLTTKPADILGLSQKIDINKPANLTLFTLSGGHI